MNCLDRTDDFVPYAKTKQAQYQKKYVDKNYDHILAKKREWYAKNKTRRYNKSWVDNTILYVRYLYVTPITTD